MASRTGLPSDLALRDLGIIDSLQLILRGIIEYFVVRCELAGLESKGAAKKVVSALIGVVVALLCLGAGFLYLSLSLVYVLAVKAAWGWGLALLASGVAMIIVTAASLFYAKKSIGGAWFPVTIDELKKDTQWLKQSATPNA